MHYVGLKRAAHGSLKYVTQNIAKNSPSAHHHTNLTAISLQLRHVSKIGKHVKQQYLPHMSSQYGELRLRAEIGWLVWGTPANFNGFRVLTALLHGSLVRVSQTLWRQTEGTTYIRQGGHHVGHWPTF